MYQTVNHRQQFNPGGADQLGAGGEGTVFKVLYDRQPAALKVFHKPTSHHQQKLAALLQKPSPLPVNKLAYPLDLVTDRRGNFAGYVMPLFSGNIAEVAEMHNKKFRANHAITTKLVAELFLDGARDLIKLHAAGFVIGDFNDRNVLFDNNRWLWIEADSWQFGNFVCQVATEQYVDPALYGVQFNQKQYFKPDNDWYSYAVMLFKSLLLVHPYGGNHPQINLLPQRAMKRVSVFDSKVIYPKIAYAIDLLNLDLRAVFEDIFNNGKRGQFPVHILENYLHSLGKCNKCGTYYPTTSEECPQCQAKTMFVMQTKPTVVTGNLQMFELIATQGPIIYHKIVGDYVYVLAIEQGKVVLYTKKPKLQAVRRELFAEIPGAKYELVNDELYVNQSNKQEVQIYDLNANPVQLIDTITSEISAITRRAVLKSSSDEFYRIANNTIVRGRYDRQLKIQREQFVKTVMQQQTWFTVNHERINGNEAFFGFSRMVAQRQQAFAPYYVYFLGYGKAVMDVTLAELEQDEALISLSAKFADRGMVVMRHSQANGKDYLRFTMFDYQGKMLYESTRLEKAQVPLSDIHGLSFGLSSTGEGILYDPADDGIHQYSIQTNRVKQNLEPAQPYVAAGDQLYRVGNGMIVVGDESVKFLSF